MNDVCINCDDPATERGRLTPEAWLCKECSAALDRVRQAKEVLRVLVASA